MNIYQKIKDEAKDIHVHIDYDRLCLQHQLILNFYKLTYFTKKTCQLFYLEVELAELGNDSVFLFADETIELGRFDERKAPCRVGTSAGSTRRNSWHRDATIEGTLPSIGTTWKNSWTGWDRVRFGKSSH